jgi:hypothetical protein
LPTPGTLQEEHNTFRKRNCGDFLGIFWGFSRDFYGTWGVAMVAVVR